MRNAALLSCAFTALLFACPGLGAQTYDSYNENINVQQLSDAAAFDAGVQGLDTGFGPGLWSGTSADLAKSLIERAPKSSASPAVTDMTAKVLLTGGTPPAGGDDAYMAARLGALVKLGRIDAVDQILGRQPQQAGSAQGQQVQADKALAAGDTQAACTLADKIVEARSEPYWAKLRAVCHVIRKEIPAGELTVDLLRRSGHDDANFYQAFDVVTGFKGAKFPGDISDPLLTTMAQMAGIGAITKGDAGDVSLAALLKDAGQISPADLRARLSKLTLTQNNDEDIAGGYFDIETAIQTDTPQSWGQLYGVVATGTDAQVNARAAGELLRRADANGVLAPFAALLKEPLALVPSYLRAENNAAVYAKLAVMQSDLGALRGLYDGVKADDPMRARFALASDALGNGFMLGQLGDEMTSRLSAPGAGKSRAVRDAFIAGALGARLSPAAAAALDKYTGGLAGRTASAADLLLLRDAAMRGAQAETALRAAGILGKAGPAGLRADSFGAVLSALQSANLQSLAGRLAAEDFLGAQ